MPITVIEKLDEGLNELINPRNLPKGGLQQSVNYETLGDNVLTKRKDPVESGAHVSGDSLKTVLAAVFTQSILQIAPPYYPVKKLSDMTGDFILLVYGSPTAGTYELYMTYENDSNTWTLTKVDITGITYTSDTYLEFFIGDDKIIITDTYNETKNFPHYVKVDAEGELITGLFSIKAPTNKPTLLPTTEFNAEEFEEDADAVRLDDCGIVQCVYTVITKEGDESNPSPISNSRMMQFFKKDLIDKNDIRWIDYFNITNLSVPVLTGDLTEQLKYFNVYFRVIRYSEGEAAEPFYFSQRFDIVDKVSNQGITGNGYIIIVPQDLNTLLSYENDIAPYAKHAAEVSSITGFANIREKTRFPFDFEKYVTLEINNVNNKNFVDAVVQIRLYDANSGESDLISDLDLTYYKDPGSSIMTNLNLIRIYDDDKITPIKVEYIRYEGTFHIDIYVKIPLLTAGQIKYLYLCFNTSTGTDLGVITSEYQTAEYGEFTLLVDTSMFDTERVKGTKTVICSPFDYQEKEDEIINLADDNNPGDIVGDEGGFDDEEGTKQLFTQNEIGTGRMLHAGNGTKGIDFTEIKYSELPFTIIPQKTTMWGRINYENLEDAEERVIYMFKHNSTENGIFLSVKIFAGEYRWALFSSTDVNSGGNLEKIIFTTILVETAANIFICLSINRDESVSLFVGNLENGNFYLQKVLWENWTDEPDDDLFEDIGSFSVSNNSHNWPTFPEGYGSFSFYHSQFQLIINKYYSAENDNDITAIYNIANFMPSFETALGLKLT